MTELAEALEDILLGATADWHTGMPARVVSYDEATETATLQPLLRQSVRASADEGRAIVEERDRAPVQGIRVLMPQGGGVRIVLPIAAGDIVWMLPASRSLAEWGGDGEAVTPRSTRRHSLSDCVAIAGYSTATPPTFTIDLTTAGKIRIGTPAVDLMQTLVDVVSAIADSATLTVPGTSGVIDPAVKALLLAAKAKLAGLTT